MRHEVRHVPSRPRVTRHSMKRVPGERPDRRAEPRRRAARTVGPVRCYSGRVSTRVPAGNSAASGGITSQRSA